MKLAQMELEGRTGQYIDDKTKQLRVGKLVEMFKWSLSAFTAGAEKIGRTCPEGLSEEIEPMAEDLEAILQKINQFR